MKIVTDCAADMPAQERENLGFIEAPSYIQFPNGEVNSAGITSDEFYNRLEAVRRQNNGESIEFAEKIIAYSTQATILLDSRLLF